jgi:hypothetical protein
MIMSYNDLSFSNWKTWLNSYDADLKLFIYSILIFPIANLGWDIVVPGIGLSVTALFTTIFIIYFLLHFSISQSVLLPRTFLSKSMKYFCVLIVLDFCATNLFYRDLKLFEITLRSLSFLIFYYGFNKVIRTEFDFFMIIKTYIYSYLVIIFNFALSNLGFSRFRPARGYDRLTLGYYDVTNVAIQSIFILAIILFLYLFFSGKSKKHSKINIHTILFFFMSLLIIKNTYHIVTYISVIGIFLIFALNKKNFFLGVSVSSFFLATLFIYLSDVILNFANIIYWDFIRAFTMGNISSGTLLHGRGSLWIAAFYEYEGLSSFEKFTGWNDLKYASAKVHNDFLRIYFSFGVPGIVTYVLIIVSLFIEVIRIKQYALKKLGLSIICILLLFSITTSPTVYTFSLIPLLAFTVYMIKYNSAKINY